MRDGEVLERTMEGGLTFTKPRLSTQPPRLSGPPFSFSGKPHFGVQVSSFPLPFGPASAITCTYMYIHLSSIQRRETAS